MYSNSNNRIITKYSEFVLQQNAAETPQPLKRVTSSELSASAHEPHELLSDSSGDENDHPQDNYSMPRAKTVISAEIHYADDSGELADPKMILPDDPELDPDLDRYPEPPPLPITDQVKFSDIFTADESHALFQRSLLLKSEAGRFLVEAAEGRGQAKSKSDSDLVVLASKVSSRASAAGISRGPPESGDDDYPVRPLNPHQHPGNISASSSIADLTSMSMRRELLNNIRAISRATFFENLYVGAAESSKERAAVANSNPELATFLHSASRRSHRPETVVSERGELLVFERMTTDSATKRESIDLWVKSSQENLNGSFPNPDVHDPDPVPEPNPPAYPEPDPDPEPLPIDPEMPDMSNHPYAKVLEQFDLKNSAVAKALRMLELNNNLSSQPAVYELNSTLSFDENVFETVHSNGENTARSKMGDEPEPELASVVHADAEHEITNDLPNGDVPVEPEPGIPVHGNEHVPEFEREHVPEIEREHVPEFERERVPELGPEHVPVHEHEAKSVPEVSKHVPEPETPKHAPVKQSEHVSQPELESYWREPEPETSRHARQPDESFSADSEQTTDFLLITGTIEKHNPEPEFNSAGTLDNIPDVGPNFMEKTDSSDTNDPDFEPRPPTYPKFQPIFHRVATPKLQPGLESPKLTNRQKTPSPKFLSYSLPINLKQSISNRLSKQVRYPSVLPRRSPILIDSRRNRRVGKLPGVLKRQNMDQWVAKIVWFYINGDRHFPKFEYRFRPGRDVRSWDGLCDILSNRLKLTRGVRYIFTTSGLPVDSVDDLLHGGSYVVSSVRKFKALNYGGELTSPLGDDGPETPKHRPPSAPTQRIPPIIRIRRERSLNGVSWGSPQQQLSGGSETNNNTTTAVTSKGKPSLAASSREAERLTQEVIGQARPVEKQVVRIINGVDPSVQSQVLLNTKVSQEWEDLVKDLGMAVKIPRKSECRMETLTGRQIQSYSQLRSELKAGNQAFYVYTTKLPIPGKNSRTGSQNDLSSSGIPLHFHSSTSLNKIKNNIQNASNPTLASRKERTRRRGTFGIPASNSNNNLLQVEKSAENVRSNALATKKSVSSSSLYDPTESSIRKSRSLSNNTLSPAASQSNIAALQRRKSTRRRSQASTYLAHRSRSPSPEYN